MIGKIAIAKQESDKKPHNKRANFLQQGGPRPTASWQQHKRNFKKDLNFP